MGGSFGNSDVERRYFFQYPVVAASADGEFTGIVPTDSALVFTLGGENPGVTTTIGGRGYPERLEMEEGLLPVFREALQDENAELVLGFPKPGLVGIKTERGYFSFRGAVEGSAVSGTVQVEEKVAGGAVSRRLEREESAPPADGPEPVRKYCTSQELKDLLGKSRHAINIEMGKAGIRAVGKYGYPMGEVVDHLRTQQSEGKLSEEVGRRVGEWVQEKAPLTAAVVEEEEPEAGASAEIGGSVTLSEIADLLGTSEGIVRKQRWSGQMRRPDGTYLTRDIIAHFEGDHFGRFYRTQKPDIYERIQKWIAGKKASQTEGSLEEPFEAKGGEGGKAGEAAAPPATGQYVTIEEVAELLRVDPSVARDQRWARKIKRTTEGYPVDDVIAHFKKSHWKREYKNRKPETYARVMAWIEAKGKGLETRQPDASDVEKLEEGAGAGERSILEGKASVTERPEPAEKAAPETKSKQDPPVEVKKMVVDPEYARREVPRMGARTIVGLGYYTKLTNSLGNEPITIGALDRFIGTIDDPAEMSEITARFNRHLERLGYKEAASSPKDPSGPSSARELVDTGIDLSADDPSAAVKHVIEAAEPAAPPETGPPTSEVSPAPPQVPAATPPTTTAPPEFTEPATTPPEPAEETEAETAEVLDFSPTDISERYGGRDIATLAASFEAMGIRGVAEKGISRADLEAAAGRYYTEGAPDSARRLLERFDYNADRIRGLLGDVAVAAPVEKVSERPAERSASAGQAPHRPAREEDIIPVSKYKPGDSVRIGKISRIPGVKCHRTIGILLRSGDGKHIKKGALGEMSMEPGKHGLSERDAVQLRQAIGLPADAESARHIVYAREERVLEPEPLASGTPAAGDRDMIPLDTLNRFYGNLSRHPDILRASGNGSISVGKLLEMARDDRSKLPELAKDRILKEYSSPEDRAAKERILFKEDGEYDADGIESIGVSGQPLGYLEARMKADGKTKLSGLEMARMLAQGRHFPALRAACGYTGSDRSIIEYLIPRR